MHVIQKIAVPLQRFNKQLIVLQTKKSKKEMKKLAFLFAAVVAVSFASCGQKAEQASNEEVEEPVVEENVCPSDTCACKCDTTATCVCDSCTCAEATCEEAPVAE